MQFLYIFDSFLEHDELTKLKQRVYDATWKYGHRNGPRETIDTKYFSNLFVDNFISDYIRVKIENTIGKNLKMTRNYMQIQEFGENGGYHVDTEIPNTYTFTIYITELKDELIEESNGEFLLKLPNEKYIISIDTYCNRGILFPSTYIHKGMAYNSKTKSKRVCVSWKFEEII